MVKFCILDNKNNNNNKIVTKDVVYTKGCVCVCVS